MPQVADTKPISPLENYESLACDLYKQLMVKICEAERLVDASQDDSTPIQEGRLSQLVTPSFINHVLSEQLRVTAQMVFNYFSHNVKETEVYDSRKLEYLNLELNASMMPTEIINSKSLNYRCRVIYPEPKTTVAVMSYVFTASESEIVDQFLLNIKNLADDPVDQKSAVGIIESSRIFLSKINDLGISKFNFRLSDLIDFLAYGNFDDFINEVSLISSSIAKDPSSRDDHSSPHFKFKLRSEISCRL